MKKTGSKKSRDTVPLNQIEICFSILSRLYAHTDLNSLYLEIAIKPDSTTEI